MADPERTHVWVAQIAGLGIACIFLGATIYAVTFELPHQQRNFYESVNQRVEHMRDEATRNRESDLKVAQQMRQRDQAAAFLIVKSIDNHSAQMKISQEAILAELKLLQDPKWKKKPKEQLP